MRDVIEVRMHAAYFLGLPLSKSYYRPSYNLPTTKAPAVASCRKKFQGYSARVEVVDGEKRLSSCHRAFLQIVPEQRDIKGGLHSLLRKSTARGVLNLMSLIEVLACFKHLNKVQEYE